MDATIILLSPSLPIPPSPSSRAAVFHIQIQQRRDCYVCGRPSLRG